MCPTCDHRLERTSGRSATVALFFAAGTFVLLFPANIEPLMKISVFGIEAARAIGELADYLDAHPESLIKGRLK